MELWVLGYNQVLWPQKGTDNAGQGEAGRHSQLRRTIQEAHRCPGNNQALKSATLNNEVSDHVLNGGVIPEAEQLRECDVGPQTKKRVAAGAGGVEGELIAAAVGGDKREEEFVGGGWGTGE